MVKVYPLQLVFLSAFSVLFFEIVLIRVFSIRLSYHFASFIISISIFGIVIGSLYVHTRKEKLNLKSEEAFSALSLLFPAQFVLSCLSPFDHIKLLWDKTEIIFLILQIILLITPFLTYGLFISLCFRENPKISGRIYGVDLIGGAFGASLVPIALDFFRPEVCLALLFLLLSTASTFLFFSRPSLFRFFSLSVASILSIALLFGSVKIPVSTYKSLSSTLKMPETKVLKTITSRDSRLDVVESPYLRLAAGLSLKYGGAIPPGIAIAKDGEISGLFLDEKIARETDFLEYLPSFAPYTLVKKPDTVLLVGFKNNIEMLIARKEMARRLFITEKDRSIHKFVEEFYTGDRTSKKWLIKEHSRSFIRNREAEFDLISISRTYYFPSGSFGLEEDYETTLDAFIEYFKALKEDGILFVQIFRVPPPRYEIRLFNNIKEAMRASGLLPIDQHLIVFATWDTISFMAKKNGYSEKEISDISNFFEERMFQALFPEKISKGAEIFFSRLPVNNYPFDVSTTTDERPFFHYFLRLSKIAEIERMTKKGYIYFIHEGMALPFLFLILISLSLFVYLPLFILKNLPTSNLGKILIYFSSIGFGFMFLEVFFIHKFILLYGSPMESFSRVVSSFLLSAGSGSLASSYVKGRKLRMIMFSLLPVLFSFYLFGKFLDSLLFPIVAGLIMGFFFPTGIRLILGKNLDVLPFAYALNGASSVIAPTLASLLALSFGLGILPLLSLLFYASALLLVFRDF